MSSELLLSLPVVLHWPAVSSEYLAQLLPSLSLPLVSLSLLLGRADGPGIEASPTLVAWYHGCQETVWIGLLFHHALCLPLAYLVLLFQELRSVVLWALHLA